jgi:hypothetical protein
MNKPKYLAIAFILVTSLSFAGPSLDVSARPMAATPTVGLGTAGSFAVLAGAAVNDSNVSVISGDVGLSPAAWPPAPALTCGEVSGTIYSVDTSGPLPCRVENAGLLTTAKNALTTAYNDADGRTPTTTFPASDNQLGDQFLTDGVYAFGHADTANLIGTLTLDAQGDPSAVWIFQASSDLITASNSVVSLVNGAQACNVFWQVSTSATLGTGSVFVGTILADQSIVDNGGSSVSGRFLARIAAVTLNDTTIAAAFCATSGGEEGGGEGERRRDKKAQVSGLPNTGGAPIRNEEAPWGLMIVGGLSAAALVLGVRSYRRTHLPKQ